MWFLHPSDSLGRRGELMAARALKREGFRILDRNVRLGRCEIDIIAQEADTIAFVEVKTRRSDDAAAPEDSVGAVKRRHIVQAAKRYIQQRDDSRVYYRFDIVSVLIPESGKPSVTIYRDAFRME